MQYFSEDFVRFQVTLYVGILDDKQVFVEGIVIQDAQYLLCQMLREPLRYAGEEMRDIEDDERGQF